MDLNDDFNEIEFTYKNSPKVFSTLRYFILSVLNVNYKIEKLNLYTRNEFGPSKASTILPLPVFLLIRDFGKQNTGENVSKLSDSLACY